MYFIHYFNSRRFGQWVIYGMNLFETEQLKKDKSISRNVSYIRKDIPKKTFGKDSPTAINWSRLERNLFLEATPDLWRRKQHLQETDENRDTIVDVRSVVSRRIDSPKSGRDRTPGRNRSQRLVFVTSFHRRRQITSRLWRNLALLAFPGYLFWTFIESFNFIKHHLMKSDKIN